VKDLIAQYPWIAVIVTALAGAVGGSQGPDITSALLADAKDDRRTCEEKLDDCRDGHRILTEDYNRMSWEFDACRTSAGLPPRHRGVPSATPDVAAPPPP
jgi:hypothetical protein